MTQTEDRTNGGHCNRGYCEALPPVPARMVAAASREAHEMPALPEQAMGQAEGFKAFQVTAMRLSTGKLIAKFIENSDRILAPIIDRMTEEEHAEYEKLQASMVELLRAVKSKPEGRG